MYPTNRLVVRPAIAMPPKAPRIEEAPTSPDMVPRLRTGTRSGSTAVSAACNPLRGHIAIAQVMASTTGLGLLAVTRRAMVAAMADPRIQMLRRPRKRLLVLSESSPRSGCATRLEMAPALITRPSTPAAAVVSPSSSATCLPSMTWSTPPQTTLTLISARG